MKNKRVTIILLYIGKKIVCYIHIYVYIKRECMYYKERVWCSRSSGNNNSKGVVPKRKTGVYG